MTARDLSIVRLWAVIDRPYSYSDALRAPTDNLLLTESVACLESETGGFFPQDLLTGHPRRPAWRRQRGFHVLEEVTVAD